MRSLRLLFAILLGAACLIGGRAAFAADGLTPAPAAADDGLVVCPACQGEGSSLCKAHCKDGKVRCPASCLKKDDPGWVKHHVDGHPDDLLWKSFDSKRPDHQGGMWWSQHHIGDLIVYENGVPVDKGKCPTCGGTGLVDCKRCGGTGKQTCEVCKGAKRVTKADADAYAKKVQAERDANAIALTDGRVLHGKVLSRSAEQVVIKTEDGKMITVKPAEIVEKPAGDPAAPAAP
jgi:hypothetical protein